MPTRSARGSQRWQRSVPRSASTVFGSGGGRFGLVLVSGPSHHSVADAVHFAPEQPQREHDQDRRGDDQQPGHEPQVREDEQRPPHDLRKQVRELIRRYDVTDHVTMHRGTLEWPADAAGVVGRAWNLKELEGRYRDSFQVMHTALTVHPQSELTRTMQQEAAESFDGLFLGGGADALSAIEQLALFYDFRELTPIGRRGDEMIRRLADRLASVDLLDQSAALLQYQVDRRLQGAGGGPGGLLP